MTTGDKVSPHDVMIAFARLEDNVIEKKALGATAFSITVWPWTVRLSDRVPFGAPSLWERTWGLWRQVGLYVSTALANGNNHAIFHDDPWHVELHCEKAIT